MILYNDLTHAEFGLLLLWIYKEFLHTSRVTTANVSIVMFFKGHIGKESCSLAGNYSDRCIFNTLSWVILACMCLLPRLLNSLLMTWTFLVICPWFGLITLTTKDTSNWGELAAQGGCHVCPALLSRLHSWIAENMGSENLCAFL